MFLHKNLALSGNKGHSAWLFAITLPLQDWYFDMKSYKATCDLFKIMKVAEQLYECGTTSKTPIRADNDSASHVRNLKGG